MVRSGGLAQVRWWSGDLLVVAMAALGIALASLAWAAVHAVLLRPFPYAQPEQLLRLVSTGDDSIRNRPVPLPVVREMAARLPDAQFAVADEWDPVLAAEDGSAPEYLGGASVTANWFGLFGVQPAAGRFFLPAEDMQPHAPAVVIAHGLWQRRFGGAPEVVGRLLRLNGIAYTVVGVAPADWEEAGLVDAPKSPEIWRVSPPYFADASRDGFSFSAVVRIAPGGEAAQTARDLRAVGDALIAQFPADLGDRGRFTALPLLDSLTGHRRSGLQLTLLAALIVWLIAIGNVVNLVLLRNLAQRGRLALCRALGASTGRLLQGLLVRQVWLALAGALFGGLLASGLVAWARDTGLLSVVPRLDSLQAGWPLFGAAVLLGVLLAVVTTLVSLPGLRRSALGVGALGGRQVAGSGHTRLRRRIVVVELALATLLLAVTAVLWQSWRTLDQTALGVDAQAVQVHGIRPPAPREGQEHRLLDFWRGLLADTSALPGVQAAGAISIAPFANDYSCDAFERQHLPADASVAQRNACAETRTVAGDVLAALGQPLLRGRDFDPVRDDAESSRVMLVSAAAAARFFAGEEALGRSAIVHGSPRTIVGIVGDVRHFGATQAAPPLVYLPLAQDLRNELQLLVRADSEPAVLAAAVRERVRARDADVAVLGTFPLTALIAAGTAQPRGALLLIGVFAGAGMVLALAGLSGVVGYLVLSRSAEFGLRLALGARAAQLSRLVLADVLKISTLGAVVGVLGMLLLAPVLRSQVHGLAPDDPRLLVPALAAILLLSLVCAALPAWRAARIPPQRALAGE